MRSDNQYAIKKQMWALGSTAIRNPYKLVNAIHLVVSLRSKGIDQYCSQNNLTLLGESLVAHGIVELGDDDTYSVGQVALCAE